MRMQLEELLLAFWQRVVEMSPQIMAAVMVLIVGWTVGRIAGKAFSKAFTKTGLDAAVKATIVGRTLDRSRVSPIVFFDYLIRWSIYLLAILGAVDLLNIEAASLLLRNIFEYLPHLIGGIVVLFVGLTAADFIGNAAEVLVGQVAFRALIGGLLKIFLYFIVAVTALGIMQIDTSLLQTFGTAMAWGVAVAFGIAFGLGFKDYVAKNASRWAAMGVASSPQQEREAKRTE